MRALWMPDNISQEDAPPLPESYSINPLIDWAEFTLAEFGEALQCEKIPLDARPIHDASTWRHLRQTYEDVMGPSRSSISQLAFNIEEKEIDDLLPAEESNNVVISHVEGKGRGILASRDIKEGEKIWTNVHFAAFHKSHDLNRFLAVLPTQLACDVILWTFNSNEDPNDFFFSVDLDLSTFCNGGGSIDNNVEWETHPVVNTVTAVATRDISAGEEILCDYEY